MSFFATMSATRHALLRNGHGGAAASASGIPPDLTRRERERLHRRLIRELGSKDDWRSSVLLTDIDHADDESLWMTDEAHIRRDGDHKLSPRARAEGLACLALPRATMGEGIRILLDEALKVDKTTLQGARVAIHGNGALAQAAGMALARAGARIVAITDASAMFYHPTGIDARILQFLKAERAPIRIQGMLQLPSSGLLNVPCEAIVLTRPLPRVGPQSPRRTSARVVLEADDGLLSPEADAHLHRRGARVVPDILGALPTEIIGHTQWLQYVDDTRWSRAEIEGQLDTQLRETFGRVDDLANDLDCTLRRAAYILATRYDAQRART